MKNSLSPILLLLCVSLLISCERKKDENISIEDMCKKEVRLYLKSNLVDPDSYVGEGWQIEVEEDTTLSPLKYTVLHEYRAKNSFGGYVRTARYFLVTEDFEVIGSFDKTNLVNISAIGGFRVFKESVVRVYKNTKRND